MYLEKELKAAIEACNIAQAEVLKIYASNFNVEIKSDNSPVTAADKKSDEIIREYLKCRFSKYAFLTEESFDDKARLNNDYVWIIDPVDGTDDFVHRDDEFTINIALSYKHEAVLGVICVPAKNELFYAVKGEGSYVIRNNKATRIHVSNKTKDLTCYTSVFHLSKKEEDMIEKHKDIISKVQKLGSSIKGCYIAEGKGDISYRMSSGTKEWDSAAFQVIVEQAGGFVLKPDGTRMFYNREDVFNREGYLIVNNMKNFLL
ncbi:MAG: 3'(2'),5'-bisphosphate nucleotidase CysQ [Bacilli bacterium]